MSPSVPLRSLSKHVCHACQQRVSPTTYTSLQRAGFTTSPPRSAEKDNLSSLFGNTPSTTTNNRKGFNSPSSFTSFSSDPRAREQPSITDILNGDGGPASLLNDALANNLNASSAYSSEAAHRFHVYSTKHNTHITFVQPPKAASETVSSGVSGTSASAADQKKQVDVLLSLSTGNIGFRKAGRGSYDAAYQLGAFVLKQMQEKGMLRDVRKMEVVLRGFGAGREAVSKVLLGSEGRFIRRYITAVMDATRLKLGGPRSPKPRRLG